VTGLDPLEVDADIAAYLLPWVTPWLEENDKHDAVRALKRRWLAKRSEWQRATLAAGSASIAQQAEPGATSDGLVLLTTRGVSRLTGLSDSLVRRSRRAGRLIGQPAASGRGWEFTVEAVEKWRRGA